MNLFRVYIFPYVKLYRKSFALTILLGLLTVIASAMLIFISGYLITRASQRPETIMLLYVPIVAVRTFGISKAVTRYLERLLGHNAVLKILSNMRVKLYEALEPQAIFIRSRFQTGDLLGTLADDIEHLQDVYIRTIFPTVSALFVFLFSVITLAAFDWIFALWIAICIGVIVFVYPLISLYFLNKMQVDFKTERNLLYRSLTDAVFGLGDWIISGRKKRFFDFFASKQLKINKLEKKLHFWQQQRTFQLQLISGAILIFMGIWAGQQAADGVIAPTYIAAFTLITFPILEGLLPVSNAMEKIPSYQESLRRLERIEQQAPAESLKNAIEPNTSFASIKVENVSFSYKKDQQPALKNISLSLQQGEKLAILGKSGAGKTTLLQLLQGVYTPDSGSITINDMEPVLYQEQIYDMISVLNQKPYLFATTVANNIRIGNRHASKEELEKVIKAVQLDSYIASLANGMETQMEETGQRFSGGERQRIALARILLKNTPIVILDEPTIGLDPKTERDLLVTLFTALHDKTVIWITHHLIGIEQTDKVIFIDKGKIEMSGTHAALIRSNQRYRQLYKMDHGVFL
ncbi:thiol reductant ABC exporter subunit CydC [Bacillaceae bacterium Marseille-Q3522]|nr:thiol reductant ABC exporter subunit CydC [Bacillaceae bacterium Marseille-Q3522]